MRKLLIADGIALTLMHKHQFTILGCDSDLNVLISGKHLSQTRVLITDYETIQEYGTVRQFLSSINSVNARIRVLVFIPFSLSFKVPYLLKCHINAVVTYHCSINEMVEAVHAASQGKRFVSAQLKSNLINQICDGNSDRLQTISGRELEVAELIKNGYTSIQIAGTLSIAVKTVDSHRYNLLRKLGAKNTPQLIEMLTNAEAQLVT